MTGNTCTPTLRTGHRHLQAVVACCVVRSLLEYSEGSRTQILSISLEKSVAFSFFFFFLKGRDEHCHKHLTAVAAMSEARVPGGAAGSCARELLPAVIAPWVQARPGTGCPSCRVCSPCGGRLESSELPGNKREVFL